MQSDSCCASDYCVVCKILVASVQKGTPCHTMHRCGILWHSTSIEPAFRYKFGPLTGSQAKLVRCLEPCRKSLHWSDQATSMLGYDAFELSTMACFRILRADQRKQNLLLCQGQRWLLCTNADCSLCLMYPFRPLIIVRNAVLITIRLLTTLGKNLTNSSCTQDIL